MITSARAKKVQCFSGTFEEKNSAGQPYFFSCEAGIKLNDSSHMRMQLRNTFTEGLMNNAVRKILHQMVFSVLPECSKVLVEHSAGEAAGEVKLLFTLGHHTANGGERLLA